MLLRNITLQDFGAYRGKQFLDLTTTPGKPIVLIGGLNGCGKTTLLDAIQLVLYGARARCSGRGSRPYESYLRESINRQADPAAGAGISLEFSITVDGEERIYKLHRSWKVSGKTLNEFTSVFINDKIDFVAGQNWPDYVEDLLPLEVASLFFFDGEKIESLADPDRAANVIESAVQSLLGVSTIEQLRSDLLGLQRRHKLSNEDQKVIDHIHELQASYADAEDQVDVAYQKKGQKQAELDGAKNKLAEADHAFETEGGDLYRRQTALETERKEVGKQLAATQDALRHKVAAGPLPLLLLGTQITAVQEQAERERTTAADSQVVDVLDQRDQWIMELLTDALPKKDRDAIAKQLDDDRKNRRNNSSAERTLNFSDGALSKISALSELLEHERARAKEVLAQAAKQAKRLESIDRLLGSVPDEEAITKRLQQRDRAMREAAMLEAEVNAAAEHYAANLQRQERLKNELERAHQGRVRSIEKAEDSARLITYTNRSRDTLDKFGDALLKRHINRLEVAVLDSLTRLMRKSGLIRNLQIDTDKFRLTLIGDDGEPIDPGRLSAGERQLLAISLLWGLARVAGNWLPSVIDTPLGRLDSKHREHLVDRYFPHASHQVLLLSTDEEIDEPLLTRLKPSIAHMYTLVHDDQEFTTSVEPGYWWTGGTSHVA
ncbi:DNA sulfur modification protein DndD [Streptomyces sp. NPDC057757]|uniref:DNA sulfur modification protein DndD n=1 Tax=Streptomyces sp. NPDC057757 TaxID=3346241 RepID=UPI00368D53CF